MALKKPKLLDRRDTVRLYVPSDTQAIAVGITGESAQAQTDADGHRYVDVSPATAAHAWRFHGVTSPGLVERTPDELRAAEREAANGEAYAKAIAAEFAKAALQAVQAGQKPA